MKTFYPTQVSRRQITFQFLALFMCFFAYAEVNFGNNTPLVLNELNGGHSDFANYPSDYSDVEDSSNVWNSDLATSSVPGGPILIISSATNPFSSYVAEILLAEGLNEFASADISGISPTLLGTYDILILGEIPLTEAQVTMLSNWADAGGTLIAFRPDIKLAPLMGLTVAGGTLADKYILINTATGPGKGLVNQTIQYHSAADLYTLNGAASLATLFSGANAATTYPAVSINNVGINGGKAIAFTYDLARSIVYTRQGNPAWAGQERDGEQGPIRSNDMFFPDWIDLNKVDIPQADEQQRLLANIIIQSSKKPMPRFWYLPRGLKAAVVMTGDDHGNGGTKAIFNQYLQLSDDNSAAAVSDWRAIRGSSYIYSNTPITNAEAKAFEDQGFEIALHLDTNCSNFTPSSLEDDLTTQLLEFGSTFPDIAVPTTNRTHCIAWSDWATQPKLESAKGIRMDANYYYWPGSWIQDRPGLFTGSAMPMRFADLDGTIIDSYQLTTQMTDESGQSFPYTIDELLNKALGPEGYYGVFTANMHTDYAFSDGSDKIIASAKSRNVPVIAAKQLLTWLDGRNTSSFGNMVWNDNELNFSVSVAGGAHKLEAMLPMTTGTNNLVNLTINGATASFRIETIKGIEYAIFPAITGDVIATYRVNEPPVVAIESPLENTEFTAPAEIDITASASDQDGTIAKVEFFNGTVKLGEDLDGNDGWNFNWIDVPADIYTLKAKATDDKGAVTISEAVNVTVISSTTQNTIVTENAMPGNPASEWQISGAGDLSIQGYATDISYNKGETARFKIKSNSNGYSIKIYRLGYYQGNGARLQGSATLTTTLPQSQPNCLTDSATGLLDCGNWSESAIWEIPATAVSGIYLAKLTRNDNGGSSHIAFVVRDDSSNSDLLFQTSDATWQAYNVYGDNNNGKSLYTGSGGKAVKVSYNRPFLSRNGGGGGDASEDWLFNAEYPMLRWIEANGYDVTYTTNVDSDRRGDLIKNHEVFLSVGHDEYWSGIHREKVVEARNAGTHLAFFSGNEVYWKTRWENSIDGSGTTHRTLVCYKEGSSGENSCSGKCDPSPEWTGLWRSGCEFTTGDPLADGCNPENALTGQISWELSDASLQVPGMFRDLRFWRNTSVASLDENQTASFTFGTIGYEWNAEQELYRSSYPNGRILLSRTVIDGKTHNISLYKHQNGALVFGAGTVQWSWGLDKNHDRGNAEPSLDMQQATLNLFADMGAQPGTRQPGLVGATVSTDTQSPVTAISFPLEGASSPIGTELTITGTASDDQVLVGVEVSTDGGNTWKLATGNSSWSYTWTPTIEGATAIQSRAFDDSGNMGSPFIANINITGQGEIECPCTVFQSGDIPSNSLDTDGQALQLGMKFQSSVDGYVTGVRFYKQSGNSGTHTGQLYSRIGSLLAEAIFTNETDSGWQEVAFSLPVAVTAGTTYIISYHSSDGYYSADNPYFINAKINGPLTGLQSGTDGTNGVYRYSGTPVFPDLNYQTSNYWVDVVFDTSISNSAPAVAITAPIDNAIFTTPVDIIIDATASDTDGTVAKVEFFQGTTKLGEDLDGSNGWSYSWINVPAGTYSLTAVATDDKGAVTTSDAVNITVNAPPTVFITAPANNATLIALEDITIDATASDTDGTISKVEFFEGTTKLGEDPDGSNGWSYAWTNVPAGTYSLTVIATDDKGAVTTSAAVNITVSDPENTAPVVAITSPADNSNFQTNEDISIIATASDTDGTVAKVEFFNGITSLGEGVNGVDGWTLTLSNAAAGTYSLTAIATDDKGAVTTSDAVNITVSDPVNAAPSVAIITPIDNAAFTTPVDITIDATASDTDGTVAKVEFFEGTTKLGEDPDGSNGWSFAWTNVPAGTYSLTAIATDDKGAVTTSEAVNITVSDPVNAAPVVAITSPADNSNFQANEDISIIATASDSDGTIAKVEFFNGITPLGEGVNGVDGWTLTLSNAAAGTYSLTAIATDDKGAVTTSDAVNITVNAHPTVFITAPANNETLIALEDITISATASDSDGTIAKVEFFNGITPLGEGVNGVDGWSFTWSTATSGTYSLTAKATDDKGAVTTSSAVNITVNAAPSVAIATPSNNATFITPIDITIDATASDTDGTIAKVEFYQGTTKLGEDPDGSNGWSYAWTNVPAGTYSLTAIATDDKGAVTTSTAVNISVSNPPSPVITSFSPTSGPIGTLVTINGNNFANATSVTFGPSSAQIISNTDTKIETLVPFVNGKLPSKVKITVTTTGGNNTSSERFTITSGTVPVNASPIVSINSPANNANFIAPASIDITASASDPDGTVVKVEFFNGPAKLGEDLTSPYAFNWNNVATGNYVLTAKATDDKGAVTTSEAVNVSVTSTTNTAPVVEITSPANNSNFTSPASIGITASASDPDGTVVKVEFFNGVAKLGEDLTSPYSFTWDNVATGNYSLTAKATDDKGAVSTSASVNITVGAISEVAAPSNLFAEWATSSQVNLYWQDNSFDEDGFVLERAYKADFTGKVDIINLSANTISYQDGNLNTNRAVYYRIKAVKGSLSSSYSNITSPAALKAMETSDKKAEASLNEEGSVMEESINIKLYPNPANAEVYLQAPNPSVVINAVAMYDYSGRYIRTLSTGQELTYEGNEHYSFSILGMPNGVYILKVYTESSGVFTLRLIKED